MGPLGCSETSVRNYHYTLHNNPEGCSSQILSYKTKLFRAYILGNPWQFVGEHRYI